MVSLGVEQKQDGLETPREGVQMSQEQLQVEPEWPGLLAGPARARQGQNPVKGWHQAAGLQRAPEQELGQSGLQEPLVQVQEPRRGSRRGSQRRRH